MPSVCVSRISGQSPLNALCAPILYAFFSFDARCVQSNAWIQPFCLYKCSHCAFPPTCIVMHFDLSTGCRCVWLLTILSCSNVETQTWQTVVVLQCKVCSAVLWCFSFNAYFNTVVFSLVPSGSLWLFLPLWFGYFTVHTCIKDLTPLMTLSKNIKNKSLQYLFGGNGTENKSHFQPVCM